MNKAAPQEKYASKVFRALRKVLPIPLTKTEAAAAAAALPVPVPGAVPTAIYSARVGKAIKRAMSKKPNPKYVGVDKRTGKRATLKHSDIEEDIAFGESVRKLKGKLSLKKKTPKG